jgi:hypothetical protein
MVNSDNTECLLCGALARGHFVPVAVPHDHYLNNCSMELPHGKLAE